MVRFGNSPAHCLPSDAEIGLKWAELLALLRKSGKCMPIKDSLIAATAIAHRLTIATRNRADFSHAGVPIVDPFSLRKYRSTSQSITFQRQLFLLLVRKRESMQGYAVSSRPWPALS